MANCLIHTGQSCIHRYKKMINNILAELREFSSSDFHVGSIAPAKLRNAIDNYPVPAGETVLALVDATVFGSAKNGMAFGHRGIYWKNDWSTDTAKNYLSWEEVAELADTMTAKGSNLFLSPACVFNLAGSQVKSQQLLGLFARIKKNALSALQEPAQAAPPANVPGIAAAAGVAAATGSVPAPRAAARPIPETPAAAPANPFPGAYDQRLLDIVKTVAKRHRLPQSVYIAPTIKVGKVKTILEACGNGVDPYSILAIVDNTFLQTGKDFLIVTDKALIAKGVLRKLDHFALADIRRIHRRDSGFYVNNHDFQCFDQLSDSEIDILCDFLRELIPALQQKKVGATGPIALLDQSFDYVRAALKSELNEDGDPEFDEGIDELVQVLYALFPIIAEHRDAGNSSGDDYGLHQLVLGYALLAGSAYHRADQVEQNDELAGLYGIASIMIIEGLVALGREQGLYLKPNASYSDVFRGAFASAASGMPLPAVFQPFLNGAPEDRKTAALAQQALADGVALLNKHL